MRQQINLVLFELLNACILSPVGFDFFVFSFHPLRNLNIVNVLLVVNIKQIFANQKLGLLLLALIKRSNKLIQQKFQKLTLMRWVSVKFFEFCKKTFVKVCNSLQDALWWNVKIFNYKGYLSLKSGLGFITDSKISYFV